MNRRRFKEMTDHERIKNWLSDGEWHCSTELDYMRDARKRISELIKSGLNIEGISCDGRCGKTHKSKTLKMRRLVPQAYAGAETPQIAPNPSFGSNSMSPRVKTQQRAEFKQSGALERPEKSPQITPLFEYSSFSYQH